jgi:hypothetical protein
VCVPIEEWNIFRHQGRRAFGRKAASLPDFAQRPSANSIPPIVSEPFEDWSLRKSGLEGRAIVAEKDGAADVEEQLSFGCLRGQGSTDSSEALQSAAKIFARLLRAEDVAVVRFRTKRSMKGMQEGVSCWLKAILAVRG